MCFTDVSVVAVTEEAGGKERGGPGGGDNFSLAVSLRRGERGEQCHGPFQPLLQPAGAVARLCAS